MKIKNGDSSMKSNKKTESRGRYRLDKTVQPGASWHFCHRNAAVDGRSPGAFSRPGMGAVPSFTRLNRMFVNKIVKNIKTCKNANFRAVKWEWDCPHKSVQEKEKRTGSARPSLCPMKSGKMVFSRRQPGRRFPHKSLEARVKRMTTDQPCLCQMNS